MPFIPSPLNKLIFLFILSLFLGACSNKDIREPEERAISRWESLIEKKWEEAYQFETPGYRKTYDITRFTNNFGSIITWRSIRLVGVNKINQNVSDVKIEVTATYNNAGINMTVPNVITERWIKEGEQWWHVSK